MPVTTNLSSFYKGMAANQSFDMPPQPSRVLVINNPNAGSIFIWVGRVPFIDPRTPSSDIPSYPSDYLLLGDLDSDVTPAEGEIAKNFIRGQGIELPAGGIWEPFHVPSGWVHIVYSDPNESWLIKGMA